MNDSPTVTIEAADLRDVRQALNAELSSAAEDLQRAADDYYDVEGEPPVSEELSASRARIEHVLRLLDHVGMGYDAGAGPVGVGPEFHGLLRDALAHRAHAIRDRLGDEFMEDYDERDGKAEVLRLMGRYEAVQALLAVLRDQTAVPA